MFVQGLLGTLRKRELEATASRVTSNSGLRYHSLEEGDIVAGIYRERLDLASGRFAMIDDGLGFSLVTWTPSLERHIGQQVSGIARNGRVEWTVGHRRDPTVE